MHIGFYSPAWPANEYTNGIITYIHYLRAELIRQGHRVTVFTPIIGRSSRDEEIQLIAPSLTAKIRSGIDHYLHRKSRAFAIGVAISNAVSAFHRRQPLDVFEMEESFGWCADVQRRLPIPVVVKLHGPAFLVDAENRSGRIPAKIAAEGEGLRQVAAIVSPSRNTLARTIARYDLEGVATRTIPNPISLEAGCQPWSLDRCERKTLLFVGRFDRIKGGDTVLLAFRRLLDADPELRLVFVGPDRGLVQDDGSQMTFEAFRDSLFDAAERASISYLGKLPRSEICALRSRAMVTLVVSRWENQPNTALEAMIQGCPIVGIDTGGMAEVIDHGATGLLARSGDIDDLCAQVLALLRDPETASRLGGNAAEVMAKRHAVAALAAQALEVYRQAIDTAKEGKA